MRGGKWLAKSKGNINIIPSNLATKLIIA